MYGLSRDVRDALDRRRDEALDTAYRDRTIRKVGRIRIEAGRPTAFGLLADHEIMDIRHHRDGGDWRTEITAQDGRIQWRTGFVSETASGNVDLSTEQELLDAAIPILEGKSPPEVFQAAFPELLQKTGVGGYEQGFVMFGPSIDENENLLRLLGLRKFWNNGQLVFIPADDAGFDFALELREGETVLEMQSESRGFARVTSLMDHRIEPGRQVVLYREDGSFYGGSPRYRVDHVEHHGSVWSTEWTSTVVLRPTIDLKKQIAAQKAADQKALLEVLHALNTGVGSPLEGV